MKRHRTGARTSAFAAAALALVGAAIIWHPAQASTRPALKLSPNAGLGGTVVRLQGSGFARNATGFVTFGRSRIAAIRTNRRGRFVTRFLAPSVVPGRAVVAAIVRVGRKRIPGTNRFRPRSLQRATKLFSLQESPPAVVMPAVVMAAGDFTSSGSNKNDVAVRDLVRGQSPSQVLFLGDYQYTYGSLSAILGGADKIWGPKPGGMWPLIKPTAGPTHDITSCTESDYKAYWGIGGMQPYSFDVGAWHVISLPSAAYRYGCNAAGILAWLKQDLAAHTNACTLAFWHEPYWTRPTKEHTRALAMKPWVQALYDAGADVILNGHQHNYQRFAPQNPSDGLDTSRGIREFVVGTGGIGSYGFTGSAANVEASDATTYGALKLTLRPTGYDWSFLRAAGGSFTDSGSGACH
jgi:hypothetical protein